MMGRNSEEGRGSRWQWTNERHVNFLNFMEASFVHSMLQDQGRLLPPLDRYLPDSHDSTHDAFSDNVESSGRRTEKKIRTLASQKSSQDQVVPQISNKRDDKDKDDRDHLDVYIGTAH